MSNLEPVLDLPVLVSKLRQQPDVTENIKGKIISLLTIPQTSEEIDVFIQAIVDPKVVYPIITLSKADVGIKKAKFFINEGDIDYV